MPWATTRALGRGRRLSHRCRLAGSRWWSARRWCWWVCSVCCTWRWRKRRWGSNRWRSDRLRRCGLQRLRRLLRAFGSDHRGDQSGDTSEEQAYTNKAANVSRRAAIVVERPTVGAAIDCGQHHNAGNRRCPLNPVGDSALGGTVGETCREYRGECKQSPCALSNSVHNRLLGVCYAWGNLQRALHRGWEVRPTSAPIRCFRGPRSGGRAAQRCGSCPVRSAQCRTCKKGCSLPVP